MLYPTKAKLGYIFSLERQLRLRMRLCFYLAIFFIYLLIIYPACPARDEKSDDPPARVIAFSFIYKVRSPDGFSFGAQTVGRGGYADLDLMKSVEILRGPASALYGSDGVAGAVTFTTKDPSDLMRSDANVGARARVGYNSADDSWTEGLGLAGRAGAFSGLLAYTRRDGKETETHGEVTGEEVVNVVTGATTTPTSRSSTAPRA